MSAGPYAPEALMLVLERLIAAEDLVKHGFRTKNARAVLDGAAERTTALAHARALLDGNRRIQDVVDRIFLRKAVQDTNLEEGEHIDLDFRPQPQVLGAPR